MTEINHKNKNVVAIGKFDGLHIGHQKLLKMAADKARQTGGVPIILFIGTPLSYIMNPSETQKRASELGIEKSVRYELTEDFRSLSGEDFVKKILIEDLGCAHAVVGYNFRFSKNRSCSCHDLVRICNKYGAGCSVIDEITVTESDGSVHAVSSTRIKELISSGRVSEISKYLGESYEISGIVSHGKHLGTDFGFPTANLIPEKGRILPSSGVYATSTLVQGEVYPSVTNIGTNPTVNHENNITVETHIIGFNGDIYNKEIKVSFLEKIRDEKKFSDINGLIAQINKDRERAKQVFATQIK